MNEQIKQQKAAELHTIVAELNTKIKEVENLGLTVKFQTKDTSNLLSADVISCQVYCITIFNQ